MCLVHQWPVMYNSLIIEPMSEGTRQRLANDKAVSLKALTHFRGWTLGNINEKVISTKKATGTLSKLDAE